MTIGIWYFVGGLALILYAAMCVYIGARKPARLFRITKLKLGGKMADETVVKICYIFSAITCIAGIVVFVIGYMNA